MNSKVSKKSIITPIGFVVICILAFMFKPDATRFPEAGPWFSILPPLIAISLAVLTGRVLMSLFAAVLIGGMVTLAPGAPQADHGWSILTGFKYLIDSATDPDNLFIIAFIFFVLAMIAVSIVSGGFHGLVVWLSRYASTRKSTQVVTYILGLLMFLDDYANTMIVGASMRSACDKHNISREKLAFLVDATAAPIAGLAVVSTWIGYEVGLFNDMNESLGLGTDGYSMLFDALGYRFYCILMLLFVLFNVMTGRDFGPMARAEEGTLGIDGDGNEESVSGQNDSAQQPEPDPNARPLARTALVPLGVWVIGLFAGLWIQGGGGSNPFNLYAWRDAISDANSIPLLAYSSFAGFIVSVFMAKFTGRVSNDVILQGILKGLKTAVTANAILICAWSLKSACDGLDTGEYVIAMGGDIASPVWFAALIFVLASITAFSIGSSWGTMAIMIPTAIPVAYHLDGAGYGLVTIITLAAILDGAIFGDHCSPISDTTIMSSIGSGCDHLRHVQTQLPYSLVVGLLAVFCGYLPAAQGLPWWLCIGIATLAILLLFYVFAKRPRTQQA